MTLSIERARDLLKYEPETGEIVWLVRKSQRVRAGDRAGTPHNRGYIQINVDQEVYLAHRLAWFLHYGVWPDGQVDHINGDRTDNRLSNLRIATQTQQNANSALRSDNTTGYRGVAFVPRRGRQSHYLASICVAGKSRYLGRYRTAEEAALAYDRAAEAAFGEFRRSA